MQCAPSYENSEKTVTQTCILYDEVGSGCMLGLPQEASGCHDRFHTPSEPYHMMGAPCVSLRGQGDARGPVAHARSETTNPGGMCSCDG